LSSFWGTSYFAGSDGFGIARTNNNGNTWTEVNNGLLNYGVLSLAVMGENLFAGTENGVFLSTNDGSSWTSLYNNFANTYVYSLVVSGSNLFAGTNNGVYLFTNSGSDWTMDTVGFFDKNVLSVEAVGENLFAAVDDSVYLSTDNGSTWAQVSTGLPHSSIWALAANNTNLFAGTYNSGVWRRPLPEMITAVKDNKDQIPAHFRLDQNFPNPFNPSTTINYSIPKAGLVTLKVYDVLGKEVATLVNGVKSAGSYHVQFFANRLASGIYFYRLIAGNSVMTKKLILMK
jgi:photosystem II stability/assembly factor-like uncharacterized protein